MIPQD